MIQDYSRLSVDELCDAYLTNVYLYLSHKMASKSWRRSAEWKIIDTQFLNDVESTIFVPDSDKFRQTIADHAELIEKKPAGFGPCNFGIDSNPILGKAIRLYFDKVNRKKKITYRSIYDEWEPTWRYHPN